MDKKLGTFLGVYTPTALTILGVIMYMRFGWVTGSMGLTRTLMIVVLSNCITFITTLSFASIATNKKIGAGGAYFIISRSLGLEIGGAVGIPLFLSQVFSITLYAFGIAETVHLFLPAIPVTVSAFVIIVFVGWLSSKGADIALKSQVPLMALVVVSIIFLAIGAFRSGNAVRFSEPSGNVTFWAAFAVFFPAVTGVMAGLGLSGDLKDPQHSIPKGAILATLTGFAVYMIIPFFLIMGANDFDLQNNNLIWSNIAPLGMLVILPGLLGAIFSSAIGSMLGAPRTLHALVEDRFTTPESKKFISSSKGKKITFIVSLVIALVAVFIGDLNNVAIVVTMFFLTVYGTINFTAAIETFSREPSWRPTIKVPWFINMAGGIGCLAVMFLINPIVAVVAMCIEFVLYTVLAKLEKKASWGDARRGMHEAVIKESLLRLSQYAPTSRNWRPYILAFMTDPEKCVEMVRFGSFFVNRSGILNISYISEGDLDSTDVDVSLMQSRLEDVLKRENIEALPEVCITESFVNGIVTAVQANGMSGFQSNTVMMPWYSDDLKNTYSLSIMRKIAKIKKSFILSKLSDEFVFDSSKNKIVHVWWGGLRRNGDLMLLLAHLLTIAPEWRNSTIKLMSIASTAYEKEATELHLSEMIPEIRINAEPHVMMLPPDTSVIDMIHEMNREADIALFGLDTPKEGTEAAYIKRLKSLAGNHKAVFFVKNSSVFTGTLLHNK